MNLSRKFALLLSAAATISLVIAAPATAQTKAKMTTAEKAAAAEQQKLNGSRYVQCDGNPNNMTAGETTARLIGAVTLLALFAPPPESADASKRKFGQEGVDICSSLIDGEAKEGNAKRRADLILARALHQIEAKNYPAAITDVKLARTEADASGLTADKYYMQSRGKVFANIESAALLRMGKPEEAQRVSLTNADISPYSFASQLTVKPYSSQVRTLSAAEDAFLKRSGKLYTTGSYIYANRLEEAGRFSDAATHRLALVEYNNAITSKDNQRPSGPMASAAISAAMAGDWTNANNLIKQAKENTEARKVAGKPDANPSALVEQFDLFSILERMRDNDLTAARRLFAARSQWTEVSFGTVMEVNRRLRVGAKPDELIGGLEKTADQLWQDRADSSRAEMVAKDANNKELFWLIPYAVPASAYESYSKNTWNTTKSKYILQTKKSGGEEVKGDLLYSANPYGGYSLYDLDAYMLHGALLAKSRGHNGVIYRPVIEEKYIAMIVHTGNCGDRGFPTAMCQPADELINGLKDYIPSPDALKQIKASRARTKT